MTIVLVFSSYKSQMSTFFVFIVFILFCCVGTVFKMFSINKGVLEINTPCVIVYYRV